MAVVLPTRKRPALAIAAIRSLLSQSGCAFQVVVSDNSSSDDDVRQLADFCRAAGDARLLYIRPPEALPMPAHWNWALEQAMARTDATHFGIQYDRKVWKSQELCVLAAAVGVAPDVIVTYGCDLVFTTPAGAVATQLPATGKLLEIRTSQVVQKTARGTILEIDQAMPVLSNCMIPRVVLEQVRARFGNICDSATPDGAFMYRSCALQDRFHHLDRALVIVYAYGYSNGLSYFRADTSGTWGDWVKLWGSRSWLDAAPIPGLNLGQNVLFHEYNLVQRAVGEALFPQIDTEGYLRELARGLMFIEDPILNAQMRAVLEEHGWRDDVPLPPPARRPLHRRILGPPTRQVRLRVRRWKQRLARRFTARPLDASTSMFASDDEAVQYLLEHLRPFEARDDRLAAMEPVEVPFAP